VTNALVLFPLLNMSTDILTVESTIYTMQKMSPIPSFAITLDIRAGRIPVRWTIRDAKIVEQRDIDGRVIVAAAVQRVFWPQVQTIGKSHDAVVNDLEDALELRTALFRSLNARWNEESALALLNKVGAWRIEPSGVREHWLEGTYATLAFRHRPAFGCRVVPVTLEDIQRDTEYWYGLLGTLGNTAKMKKAFAAPPPADAIPADQFAFATEAHFFNTLEVSLEWQGEHPRAVVEPLTASELLSAAAWADVVSRTDAQVCARCQTRFTWPRKKVYCLADCAHRVAVRTYKRKMAALKRAQMVEKKVEAQ
jgi:hypothetical protein